LSNDDSVNIETRDVGGGPRKMNYKEVKAGEREVTQELRNAFLEACYRGDDNKLEEILG